MYQQTKDRLQILKELGYAIYMYYAYAESTEGFDLVEKDGTMNSQLQAMQGGRRTWITDDHQ